MENEKDILTVSEAAKMCSVTRATIWRWIKAGRLRSAATAGGHHRIHMDDLKELKKKHDMGNRIRSDRPEKRILIVEDDPNIRKILSTALSKDGYDVTWASDGFEAGIQTMKFQPDLIILDLFMPRLDGFEVCRRLKEDKDTAHTKVLAMSGFDTEENRQRILGCGADRFLSKPIDIKSIRKEIAEILKGHEPNTHDTSRRIHDTTA